MIGKIKVIDALTMLVLFVVTGFVIYGIVLQIDSISGISSSTRKREKIESAADPLETLYDVDPSWTGNLTYIDAVLPAFREATGVTPYLKVLGYDAGSDESALQQETDSLYENRFSDEDHFLFVFSPQTSGTYLSAERVGSHAAQVMDAEALTIFHQYLDKFFHNPECGPEDLFLRTYRSTYERIMGTAGNGVLYTILLCILVAGLIVLIVRRTIRILRQLRG